MRGFVRNDVVCDRQLKTVISLLAPVPTPLPAK